jgi:heme oxygenase
MEVLEQVRQATRDWHDEMERIALSDKLMSGAISLKEYGGILLGHYVFHRQQEQQLLAVPHVCDLPGFSLHNRFKTDILYRDLQALKLQDHTFAFEQDFVLSNLPQALGSMYVTEGSTLGGNVIRKKLQQHPMITNSGALHFYGCYGNATGQMWKRFRQTVALELQNTQAEKAFLDAANATFRNYARCMRQSLALMPD